MGLDMYLTAERFIWHNEQELVPDLTALDIPPTAEISTITVRAGCWRKANAIHKWFVDNIQDGVDECQKSYVSYEELHELQLLCKQVLADRSLAKSLLPTKSGFFFGSTDYDEWYFKDLEHTVEIIDKLPDPAKFDFYYQSSW